MSNYEKKWIEENRKDVVVTGGRETWEWAEGG